MREKQLTDLMRDVLTRMRKSGLEWVAASAESEWLAGRRNYIDDRCKASRKIRSDFERCNVQATGEVVE